jgi:hypothetical protein
MPTDDSALGWSFTRYPEQERYLLALLTDNYPSEWLEKKVQKTGDGGISTTG